MLTVFYSSLTIIGLSRVTALNIRNMWAMHRVNMSVWFLRCKWEFIFDHPLPLHRFCGLSWETRIIASGPLICSLDLELLLALIHLVWHMELFAVYSNSKTTDIEAQLCHVPSQWPYISCITFLSLNFFMWITRIEIIIPSWVSEDIYQNLPKKTLLNFLTLIKEFLWITVL